jgi:acyl-CoA reductase-like NAD-dependent aldehyde dehydrogenase
LSEIQPLFALGEWRVTSHSIAVHSPHDGALLGEVASADEFLLGEALAELYAAREVMVAVPTYERVAILEQLAHLVELNQEDLAHTIALEAGKPIRDARTEAKRAVLTLRTCAAVLRNPTWECFPLDHAAGSEGRWGVVRRFPIGVVLGISPFNYPLNLVCHKLGPALAAGCPFLLKPASATPLTAIKLVKLALLAGWNPQAIAVVPCAGPVAQSIVSDERVALITFTGSHTVGWHIRELAPRKPVVLELGGNAATIVWDDADLVYAIPRLVMGSFVYAGQVCIKVQRIIIARSIYNKVKEELVACTRSLLVGDPLHEDSDVGPMISAGEADRAESWLSQAVAAGAKVLCGGERQGNYLMPTIVENCPADQPLNCDEVFAPITVLIPADTFKQAVDIANQSPFGLQCGVLTRDMGRIDYAHRHLGVGGVIAGDVCTYRIDPMPYGGEKESGMGREGPRYAMEEMSQKRLLVFHAPYKD